MEETNTFTFEAYENWLSSLSHRTVTEMGMDIPIDTLDTTSRAQNYYSRLNNFTYLTVMDDCMIQLANNFRAMYFYKVREYNEQCGGDQAYCAKQITELNEDSKDSIRFVNGIDNLVQMGGLRRGQTELNNLSNPELVSLFTMCVQGILIEKGFRDSVTRCEDLKTLLLDADTNQDLKIGLDLRTPEKLVAIRLLLDKSREYGLSSGQFSSKFISEAREYAKIQQTSDEDLVQMFHGNPTLTPQQIREAYISGFSKDMRSDADQYISTHPSSIGETSISK